MAVHPDGPAPYAPPKTVLGVIDRFRSHGLTTPFTADVLMRAGVTESLAPRTLQALRLLDLIDESGNPTDDFLDFSKASSDEVQERFAAMIRSAYADVFSFTDPAKDPIERIQDAFRPYKPRSQRDRMVTLFMGLCERAGMVSELPKRAPSPARTPSRRPTRAPTPTPVRRQAPRTPEPEVPGLDPALAGLLSKLPVPGGSWTKGERDSFLRVFGSVLDFTFPIRGTVQGEPNLPDEHEEEEEEGL